MGLDRPAAERDTNLMEVLMDTNGTTTTLAPTPMVAIDRIVVDPTVNHRPIDAARVADLAASMRVFGMTDPIDIKEADGRLVLVAGEHRLLAAREAGLTEVPYHLVDGDRTSARTAIENIARADPNPLEQARAVGNMLAEGFTYEAIATALGWRRRRGENMVPDTGLVKARARILDLPAEAQQLVADGTLQLPLVARMLDTYELAPELTIDFCNAIAAGKMTVNGLFAPNSSGRFYDVLEARDRSAPFAAVFDGLDEARFRALRLGKKTTEQWEAAAKLLKELDGTTYWSPRLEVMFEEIERDQAAAVRALLTFGEADHFRSVHVILDRGLYRDLARQAIRRKLEELQDRKAKLAAERAARRDRARGLTAVEIAESEHRAQHRDIDRAAHGVNLDLWRALRDGLEVVDPANMDVARFYVYGILGGDWRNTHWSPADDRAKVLAANGIRLVVAEHRTETTPTLKSGKRGRTKITYGDARAAADYLWTYIDGARTAGELFGRGLVVFAALDYALQRVLPRSRRAQSQVPYAHDDHARKALAKLAEPVLPVSLRELQRRIARVDREHKQKVEALQAASERRPNRRTAAAPETVVDGVDAQVTEPPDDVVAENDTAVEDEESVPTDVGAEEALAEDEEPVTTEEVAELVAV